jgi:hypothetical protein
MERSQRVLIGGVYATALRKIRTGVRASRRSEDESVVAHHASTRIRVVERMRACRAAVLISMRGAREKRAAKRVLASPISSQLRQASAQLWPMCWRALGLRHGRSDGGN